MCVPLSEASEESQLVDLAREGDLGAFNCLVETYQRPVYNLCLRMLSAPQAAEDATQEAFISAFRSLDSFRGGSFRSWLFRIAANACYDEMRRRRSRAARSLDSGGGEENDRPLDVPDTGLSPDEHAENVELRQALRHALLELPHDQRLLVVLRDVQGFEYAEIAEITGTQLGTVKSRLNRARSRLRELLQESGELLPRRLRQSK